MSKGNWLMQEFAWDSRTPAGVLEKMIVRLQNEAGRASTPTDQIAINTMLEEVRKELARREGQQAVIEIPNFLGSPITFADIPIELPPIDWLVQPILETEQLVVVYGMPGAVKSLLCMDLAICVALGYNWLPGALSTFEGYSVTQAPTYFLNMDMSSRQVIKRMWAFRNSYDAGEDTPMLVRSMPKPEFDPGHRVNDLKELIDDIGEWGAKLVIIDTLSKFSHGANENTAEMDPIMSAIRQVIEATGASVLTIHHTPKDNRRTPRGHSTISANADLEIFCDATGNDGSGCSFTVEATKIRSIPFPDMELSLSGELTEEGIWRTTEIRYVQDISRPASPPRIAEVIPEEGISRRELYSVMRKPRTDGGLGVTGSNARLDTYIDKAISIGYVESRSISGGTRLHSTR